MEDWEINRRAELELSVQDGAYQIGTGDFIAYTGKGGYINYQIAIEKLGRGMEVIYEPKVNDSYLDITEEKIKELMNELYERRGYNDK